MPVRTQALFDLFERLNIEGLSQNKALREARRQGYTFSNQAARALFNQAAGRYVTGNQYRTLFGLHGRDPQPRVPRDRPGRELLRRNPLRVRVMFDAKVKFVERQGRTDVHSIADIRQQRITVKIKEEQLRQIRGRPPVRDRLDNIHDQIVKAINSIADKRIMRQAKYGAVVKRDSTPTFLVRDLQYVS